MKRNEPSKFPNEQLAAAATLAELAARIHSGYPIEMPVRSVAPLALAIWAVAAVLLARPPYVAAFECGGGSEWLESEAGEMCLWVADLLASESNAEILPEQLARMEHFVADRARPRHHRAVVAAARCEVALLRGAWADAERYCALSSRTERGYADTHGADASQAIAVLHQRREREAVRLADRFAHRECDSFRRAESEAFDQGSACARAFAVLRRLDPDSEQLRAREERFAGEWGYETPDELAARRLAACLVAGTVPCAR